MITLYRTTKQVEQVSFDENDLFNFIKEAIPNNEEFLQGCTSFEEIKEKFGYEIWEYEKFIEEYCKKYSIPFIRAEYSRCFYNNFDDAYTDMEWGIH